MTDRTLYTLHILALLGTGLVAGTFFAFSSFIMAALERLPTAQGIAIMQAINLTVINPLFMGVLFGTAVLCGYLGYHAYGNGFGGRHALVATAALLYVACVIGTTMVFNVPLNNALAVVDATTTGSVEIWRGYLRDWTFWNSMRGVAATASTILFAMALN
jgi:uncharacterized membrane protein